MLACVATLAFAACGGHTRVASATPRDRAACSELGVAYVRFNAYHGGPIPTAAFQSAISVAKRADNLQLRNAIVSWVTTMESPATGRAAAGAPYATQECRQIGVPLRFGAAPAPTPGNSTPGQTPTSASEGGDDD